MSEISTTPTNPNDWRERIKKYGKQAFVLEEMLKLGFWPPSDEQAFQREKALAELKLHRDELAELRRTLADVENKINTVGNIEVLVNEIRKRRIERVKAAREAKRARQTADRTQHTLEDRARRQKTPPFLGHEVSKGLRYTEGQPDKLAALGLPPLNTAEDIAAAIGIGASELSWLTYHRAAATLDHYHRFTIPKRNGGKRTISSPKSRLRVAQSWLLEGVLSRLKLHDAAMAFRPARSILDNARRHQGQAIVIRMDLKDFFPSVGLARVKRLFMAFGYNEGVATIMALLATEAPRAAVTLDGQTRFVSLGQRSLPQGACTSPALTNILCRTMDARLLGLAKRYGFIYTRYADDCVFSHPDPEAKLGGFLAKVRKIIGEEGFVVNEDKTRVMRRQHRQVVTGLVVNHTEPRLSRTDLRRFRSFLHHCEKDGLPAMNERLGKPALPYAQGYLSFIAMVAPAKAAQLQAAHPWLNRTTLQR